MNIILIGMPGCGKSTCGVLAAKAACKTFVDTDLLIQAEEGMKLQQIIETKGAEYFAHLEEKILTEVQYEDAVIATGGSAVYYEKAMEHLKSIGKVVYIRITLWQMLHRIKNIKTRGILLKSGESLYDMYQARTALYERYADVVLDSRRGIEDTVSELCKLI